jgi:cobalt/nickel transport system ATP-binding protein
VSVIETESITYYYEGSKTPSMKGVSISIKKGVKTVILGANGAGKSTLFYHFNGVVKPKEGVVRVMGEPVSYRKKGLKALRSKVAVVLQNPDDQVFGQTVEADIAYGPRNMKLPEEEVKQRVEEALFQTGLGDLRSKNTLQLSYGQRKRLALAGALAMRPEVLIMDEPTAGLDPQMALELMELAEQLHHKGTTIVISTHDVDLAYAWADEIHVLRKGELIFSGSSEDFYCDPLAVHSTGVMQPSMFIINGNLAALRGEDPAPYPRTESQLVSKMASGPKGRMTVVPTGADSDAAALGKILAGRGDSKVGVFGTSSRRMMYGASLPADYVFNGFESCMGECLMGRDSMLVCDSDSLPLIESKILRLKDFGTDVEFETIRLGC